MKPLLFIGDISAYFIALNYFVNKFPDHKIIALGDLIDRGPDSKKVIEFFINNPDHQSLMGNHEHMFIKTYEHFIDKKETPYFPPFWIYRNGGDKTLESYGIKVEYPDYLLIRNLLQMNKSEKASFLKEEAYLNTINQFDKIPKHHIDFLNNLPLTIEGNDFFCSHAPVKNWNFTKIFNKLEYDKDDFILDVGTLWNRKPGKKKPDNKFIIYGHNNVENILWHSDTYPNGRYDSLPDLEAWGVCLDTMKHGRLTALEWPNKQIHQIIIKGP